MLLMLLSCSPPLIYIRHWTILNFSCIFWNKLIFKNYLLALFDPEDCQSHDSKSQHNADSSALQPKKAKQKHKIRSIDFPFHLIWIFLTNVWCVIVLLLLVFDAVDLEGTFIFKHHHIHSKITRFKTAWMENVKEIYQDVRLNISS